MRVIDDLNVSPLRPVSLRSNSVCVYVQLCVCVFVFWGLEFFHFAPPQGLLTGVAPTKEQSMKGEWLRRSDIPRLTAKQSTALGDLRDSVCVCV